MGSSRTAQLEEDEIGEMLRLEDAYQLAARGIYGEPEQVRRDLLGFAGSYRNLLPDGASEDGLNTSDP